MKLKVLSYLGIGLAILVIIVSISPFQTRAAVSPSAISVDIMPLNPAAGESTTIALGSFATNLDSVSISWYVNGKKVSAGIGMKTFSVNAPATGSSTTVRAVVSLVDGDIEKKVVISPNVMVLLYQATDSYVPPFYRGKALPTVGSDIKVVAMPEAKNISPQNMLYAWKRNYTNDATGSGYGKNSLTYTNDYLSNSDNVSVTVSSIDGKYSSEASLDIGPTQPKISFYKNDTLLGTLWEQALTDGHMVKGDEVMVAEPYFISPKELWNPSLVWNWYINDSLTDNTSSIHKNWLPIKIEGGSTGTSALRLDISSNDQILETASKQINVTF
ncbi:MAG: hypothetical protein KGL67_00535 [Patescibacteria group bacterium]|nr:hypothetical protein [Patescibacteria group bacterium]